MGRQTLCWGGIGTTGKGKNSKVSYKSFSPPHPRPARWRVTPVGRTITTFTRRSKIAIAQDRATKETGLIAPVLDSLISMNNVTNLFRIFVSKQNHQILFPIFCNGLRASLFDDSRVFSWIWVRLGQGADVSRRLLRLLSPISRLAPQFRLPPCYAHYAPRKAPQIE